MQTLSVKQNTQVRQEEQLPAVLRLLKKAIWERRPILGEIMARHGGQTLYDYARDFLDVNPSPILDARKPQLIAAAADLVEARLGREVAQRVTRQLTKLPLVSTADHHGPIDHPFWVNANIISYLPYRELADPDLSSLIVFSFASVSVNNASAYPRGILFHGGFNGSGNLVRLPILPDKLKMGVVYSTRAFTTEDLTRAEIELRKRQLAGEILPERASAIADILRSVFSAPSVLDQPDLASQITRLNYELWPRLFRAQSAAMPDLIYLDIETLVAELLQRHHLFDEQSLVHQLLFNPARRQLALKHFNNLPGAFSTDKNWGTFCFWGVDARLHHVRLTPLGDRLVSSDGSVSIALEPEAIASALREKKIFPSMLTCYLLVSLYYGMKCLGGFCQVHDLTMIKQAWRNLLAEVGQAAEAEAIMPVQTKELGGDGMVLSYTQTARGDLVPATGIDMMLDGGKDIAQHIELSKRVTLEEMMHPMLPEMYSVLYASHERQADLLRLTPEQIVHGTGLVRKLLSL